MPEIVNSFATLIGKAIQSLLEDKSDLLLVLYLSRLIILITPLILWLFLPLTHSDSKFPDYTLPALTSNSESYTIILMVTLIR